MARTVRRAPLAVVPDEIVDAELVEELTRDEAEAITRQLVGALRNWHAFAERVTELALKAYYGQAFKALGYESWTAYAAARFGGLEMLEVELGAD